MKLVNIAELKPGMVLAQNVYTVDDQLVLPKGTKLDESSIKRLNNYSVLSVFADERGDLVRNVRWTMKPSYSERLKRSPEFAKFKEDLEQNAGALRKTMQNIVNGQIDLDIGELTSPVADLISDAGNGMGALEMLLNLREYNDAIFIHSLNVALVSNVLARWMKLSQDDVSLVTAAALLHDIGKVQIPKELLDRDRVLAPKDEMIVRTHVTKGYEMLKNTEIDKNIKNAVLMHHERRDGSGYPFRLQGEQIDPVAGIIAVADTYDEWTSVKGRKEPQTPFAVIAEFEDNGLMKYDTAAVMTFLSQIAVTFLGNRVRLTNGMEGELIYINPDRISRPTVKCDDIFFDLAANPDVEIAKMI